MDGNRILRLSAKAAKLFDGTAQDDMAMILGAIAGATMRGMSDEKKSAWIDMFIDAARGQDTEMTAH